MPETSERCIKATPVPNFGFIVKTIQFCSVVIKYKLVKFESFLL